MYARTFAITAVVLIAAASRLLPHPPNVTPIAAMALLAGASLHDFRVAVAIPLGAMFLSDLFLGMHGTIPFVYGSMVLITGIGTWLRGRRRPTPIAAAAVAGAVLFYVITNFGVWATSTLYPKTAAGLSMAYAAGLPFFRNTLLGDLVYCALLFGGFALIERIVPAVRAQTAPAPGQ
jgi:hypothetical protein